MYYQSYKRFFYIKGVLKVKEKHKWYILKVITGHEMRIQEALKQIMRSEKLKDLISDVKVITHYKKMKNGELRKTVRKEFKSFVFVKMVMNDTTYNAVKISNVLHILGFDEPEPMSDEEAKRIFALIEE